MAGILLFRFSEFREHDVVRVMHIMLMCAQVLKFGKCRTTGAFMLLGLLAHWLTQFHYFLLIRTYFNILKLI